MKFNTTEKNLYQNDYSETSTRLTGFFRLMYIWKGSVLKLIYHNILIFLLLYFSLSLLYREVFWRDEYQRELFEIICIYAQRFSEYIPITFLTGFYVSQVVTRWWGMFTCLPFPDRIALKLISYCSGKDHFTRNLRRTVMRYVNLSTILAYRLVSQKVSRRFPTMESLMESKLILPHEADRLSKVDHRTPHESTWTPLLWALKLLQRARAQGKVSIEAPVYSNLVSSFEYIENCNRNILNYGWVEFPLAYTQVATISVYTYFFAALFGRQYLVPRGEHRDNSTFPAVQLPYASDAPYNMHTPDFYVPWFTMIQFISYMGWIKVAETLLNPFGDDDEDFEINYLIDRNLQVSYLIVDEADGEMEMAEDPFLEAGISIPEPLPYDSRSNSTRSTVRKKISNAFPIPHYSSKTNLNKDDLESVPHTPAVGRRRPYSRQPSERSVISQDGTNKKQYSPAPLRIPPVNMSMVAEETDTIIRQLDQDSVSSRDVDTRFRDLFQLPDQTPGSEDEDHMSQFDRNADLENELQQLKIKLKNLQNSREVAGQINHTFQDDGEVSKF